MNPVLAWMQERIAYWERERQMADLVLQQEFTTSEVTRAEQRMRKMLATRIVHQLETLENEVNRGQ